MFRNSTIAGLIGIILFCSPAPAQTGIHLRDVGLITGFQDTSFGHHKRGRASIAADFDLDGYIDFYIGNPGDESYVLRSLPGNAGSRKFEQVQILIDSAQVTWGGVAFDYDNDGDPDLFLACGGNEGNAFDYLWRNDWIADGQVTGNLEFVDVTEEAGVRGIVPEGEPLPIKTASGNAVVADYDNDGDLDIFVNGNIKTLNNHPELEGRNTLWRNNSNGTFTDVTVASGLGTYRGSTRHSTFFDFDNDNDMDLYENVYGGCNVLWRNNGDGTFTDVTAAMTGATQDLSDPIKSFASVAADFNNDGWEDLMVFMRGGRDGAPRGVISGDCGCNGCDVPINPEMLTECDGVLSYPDGHALFMNRDGEKFVNVALTAGFNEGYLFDNGVMGCQIGDLNYDGIPDIYVGNGGPDSGAADKFYLSTGLDRLNNPLYENSSDLIDFPAVIPAGWEPVSYPYRTHGISFIDFDNDGHLEVAVVNGGPISRPDSVREPNRLFKLRFLSTTPPRFLKVHLTGNGTSVSKDAVGSRVRVTALRPDGSPITLYRTLYAGASFSAQNGFDLHFGLGDVRSIQELEVVWPDGSVNTYTDGINLNSLVLITMDAGRGVSLDVTPIEESSAEESGPPLISLEGNYPNPFNPATVIRYRLVAQSHVGIAVYNLLGQEVKVLVDEIQNPGDRSVTWDGRDSRGIQVSSGIYLYRIVSGSLVETRKMLLTK